MMKTLLSSMVVLSLWRSASGVCEDSAGFVDELGQACSAYAGVGDCRDAPGLTSGGLADVLSNCQASCDSCVKAAEFCEIGRGGAPSLYEPPRTDDFEYVDQELLNDVCRWLDKPEGLHMASNAWGNQPGQNLVMGCIALIKDIDYTDFILEIDAYHDDNDAFGFIFGYKDDRTYYQVWGQNDYWWPPRPADGVPGPVLKMTNRANTTCYPEMNASNACYETIAFNANYDSRHESHVMADYPNGRNSSVPFYPEPYVAGYRSFHHNNVEDYVVRMTLIVYKGEARAYFYSDSGELVGVWTDLADDYAGGRLGIFVSAHQPTITRVNVLDISDGAPALTSKCAALGAVCDEDVGVCFGGPTAFPTAQPSAKPTAAMPTPKPTSTKTVTSCVDDPLFVAENGEACAYFKVFADCRDATELSAAGLESVLRSCQASCDSCVKARDFCEIGVGGDPVTLEPPQLDGFDFIDQELLDSACRWENKPEGLHMASNAWGNQPGQNLVMGCMALIKDIDYKDFILEVDAYHDDNDAFGFIFGYQDERTYYQAWAQNDDWWPPVPADRVPGTVIKMTNRANTTCYEDMNASNACYSTFAYNANSVWQPVADYPNGRVSSVPFYPEPYADGYRYFHHNNVEDYVVRMTLIVNKGEARAYFYSDAKELVGVWGGLPVDYVGGRIGVFVSAHQPTITRVSVLDISENAAPLTSKCAVDGAVCDADVGVCLGGPTAFPTGAPTSTPTMGQDCQSLDRHPASDFCPSPVGGDVTNYDVAAGADWTFIDQPLLSEPCNWVPTAGGLFQSTNAWGNFPGDNTLMGCMALVAPDYTDVVAEFDAIHSDNDGWGFVFGYKNPEDHYIAHTINDVWPQPAADGIGGPHMKIRKANGKPCLPQMNASNTCYDLIAWVNADGYSDMATTPRAFEYEYSHGYATGTVFQPHKLTLIIKGQEARVLYHTPDNVLSTPINKLRQGNKYQAVMTFDLQGYAGGRLGPWTYAHQMFVTSFSVTDISDDANLPETYCGGSQLARCDVGVTGLCLAVAAPDVCEGALGGDTYDVTTLDAFDFVNDPEVASTCDWSIGSAGYLQQVSNANLNEGVLLGCNAIVSAAEYTDFVYEVDLVNNDNDGVGINFGWKSEFDYFRVQKINDVWPSPAADSVGGPALKLKRRIPGMPCDASPMNETNLCMTTISFIDPFGVYHDGIPDDAVAPAGNCGYSREFLPFAQGELMTLAVIAKDNQLRATFESPTSARQVTVMAFDLAKYDYQGGKVGLFTFAHQMEVRRISVLDLAAGTGTFCGGTGDCSARTGRCLGAPTVSPTLAPSASPTVFPRPNVAANEYCQGAVSATATTLVDTSDLAQFDLVDHPLLSEACSWSTSAEGLAQTSNAWGNFPGDNTLMGCMAIFSGATYTDFIAEIDVTHVDNDGWGVVFGYNAIDDHYLGVAVNDRWPQQAADGIDGPFLKIKKHNGKPVLPNMDASNVVFDTLSHLDAKGFNREAMEGATGFTGIPKEYEATYPYRRGENFEDTKIVLIVKGQEARLYYPTPQRDVGSAVNNLRQPQTATATWTFDLNAYAGGKIGVFTYSHAATFSSFTITDLAEPSSITAYCDGVLACDNDRGEASTGLCFGVPVSDVCEDPVGATVIDTGSFTPFEIVEDPSVADCVWSVGGGPKLYQDSNSFSGNTVMLGCNAIVKDLTFTDFILQVDIDNDDNDGVGLQFGWKSLEDHFRVHKVNDNWPNPSYDGVPGPVLKVRRKRPDVACDGSVAYDLNSSCYQTISYIDTKGASHDAMPTGAVAPFEYSRTYLPFSQAIKDTRMVLIVRDNALRAYYEDAQGTSIVAVFSFDLTPYDYTGGRVGLFVAGHQAGFSNLQVGELSGANAITDFCANGGTCDTTLGLCK